VDNCTFRLGEDMSVRLPAAERYTHQVEKEHRWLRTLSRHLPMPIPAPIARGEPGHGYPWRWSIYRWLPGATAASERVAHWHSFAADLGSFLAALHRIDPAGGPPATDRNWFRADAIVRDEQTQAAISALDGVIDVAAAREVWEAARHAPPADSPTWIHGDVSPSNLLVVDGRLSAVIDFGCSGIGDPAFDLEVAWDLLSHESRAIFRTQLGLDCRVGERPWLEALGRRSSTGRRPRDRRNVGGQTAPGHRRGPRGLRPSAAVEGAAHGEHRVGRSAVRRPSPATKRRRPNAGRLTGRSRDSADDRHSRAAKAAAGPVSP
jgi:aminoglycoside phosphotransferase (APT) family kinase protein